MSLSKQLMFEEMEEDELLDGNEEDGEPVHNEAYIEALKAHIRAQRERIQEFHAIIQREGLRTHRLETGLKALLDKYEPKPGEGLNLDQDRPEDLHFRVIKGSA